MASEKRDCLIDTALELFNRDGYHATGIDRILAECGIAKMTLYKHFKSKDELILATLTQRDARWLDWFRHAIERRAETPRGRLLAVFDALEEWFARPDFNGCMFIKAAAEYSDYEDPIHAAAVEHHRMILAELRDLATTAGAKRPGKLARDVLLLMLGAIVATQVNGPVGAGKEARKAAEILIAEAIAVSAPGTEAA